MSYYVNAAAASQRAAYLRAEAEARRAHLMKKAASATARLEAADAARSKGDLMVASRLYVSLALTRQPTPASRKARERLD